MPRYEGYPLMHVYTKSFYSNSLFNLRSDLKSRPTRTHLLADRKPRPLQKTKIIIQWRKSLKSKKNMVFCLNDP